MNRQVKFEAFEEVAPYFKELINTFKQMNYSEFPSDNFDKYEKQIREFVDSRRAK